MIKGLPLYMKSEYCDNVPDFNLLTVNTNRLAPILERYLTDLRTLHRKYSLAMSALCSVRIKAFYSSWFSALIDFDFDSLNKEERIDYILFRNHLKFQIRKLDQQSDQLAEMSELIPFAASILELEEMRIQMIWIEPEAAAIALNNIVEVIKSENKNLTAADATELPKKWKRSVANRAAGAIVTLQSSLKEWYTFYNGYDPLFTWWVESPYNEADKEIKSYGELIKRLLVDVVQSDAGDIIGDPIGSAALTVELKSEMIPYSPQELIDIANKELAWCEAELKQAAQEMGFGDDTRAALEHVKTLYVPPGGQPELIKSLALEAINYQDEHNLLTIDPLARETWRLEMMSPADQRVNPFFLGGETILVSYPTNTMSHNEKMMSMRGNNAHFARATVQHELIPGHNMQCYIQERSRTYRRPFHTPFWIEGWTIYWEFLLYQKGFPKGPEDRVGMLFWRMHRCVRIIFSLSFHLETMTPQECVEMLVDKVGHERANAVAEVRRSCGDAYPPLYQCAYLLGGLQVWALRQELVEQGGMEERSFHDALIRENCIPIEMVRADLTGLTLPKDFESNWRFYSGS